MTFASKPVGNDIGPDPEGPDPVSATVSELISDITARLTEELAHAELVHAPKLQEALSAVRDSVRRELAASLRSESESRVRESMELAKQQFAVKLAEVEAEQEEERNHLIAEISELRRRSGNLSAELINKQAELEHLHRETAMMIEDPGIEIARIIRHRALISELEAYLRGLLYWSADAPKDTKLSD